MMKEVVFYGDDPRAERYLGKYGSKKIKITQQLQPSTIRDRLRRARLRKKEKKSFLKKLGFNPHLKVHSRKYWKNQIKKNPNKVITIIMNLEKIIIDILKRDLLSWGYRPPLEHSPIRLSKGKIKFKTRRKARFRKGSPEAKRYMANLRRMRK